MSSVSRGFSILNHVARSGDGATFSEIVAATGLPKATAHRLLKELVELSALQLDTTSRRYTVGLLLARLGAAATADYDLRRVARPHLEALHRETGHVATLGILSGDEGTYLDKIEARDFGIRLHSEIGKAFPLHCTAMGKVFLSHADAATVGRILARKLESYTEHTVTGKGRLRAQLGLIRERGYAIDEEEITRGLVCVAAPVFGIDDDIAGAMSCTFPSYVLSERGIDKEVDAVVRHARAASGQQAREE